MKTQNQITYTYFDTVALELPGTPGNQYALFRNLADKGPLLTNIASQQRLPSGSCLEAHRLSANCTQWSGDFMLAQLLATAHLEVAVNRKLLFSGPLRDATSFDLTVHDHGVKIDDTDDLRGHISFSQVPPAWERPQLVEWKSDYYETTDEELMWTRLIPSRFRKYLPRMRYSRTCLHPVSRPLRGVALVSVGLGGVLTWKSK